MQVIHKDIFLIPNFLTKEECQNFILKSERLGFEEAKVQVGKGKQSILKGVRNNDRVLYMDEELAKDLFQRALSYLPSQCGIYDVQGLNEMFRFYKYSSEQRFKMHRDGSFSRSANEESFYTFMIYLNDDFEGGETEFENIAIVKPEAGSLLVFYHPYRHEGKIVTSGLKYVLRTDVMYKRRE